MPKQKLNDPFIRNYESPEKRVEIYDEYTDGLVLRVSPAGTKTFYFRYGAQGKRFKIGRYSNISLAEAREIAKKKALEVANGKDPQAEKVAKRKKRDLHSFEELAKEFKEKHLPTLRESTKSEYERIIDVELIPALGNRPINEIDKREVVQLLDKKAYKDDAPAMANHIRLRLSRIYTFAIERGYIDDNPVENTPTYEKGRIERDRFYDEDEIRELWKYFEMQKEPTQSVLKMLLITGQRKTETMNMRWDLIRNDTWTIPVELAKGKKPHEVPLSEMALEIIEKMRPLSGKSDYVFKSPRKDNEPIKWLSRARRFIQKNSKVSDFRPHDLRRTVTTHMSKLGIRPEVAAKIRNSKEKLGGGPVGRIYDRYDYMEERVEAMNKWSDHLQEILNEKPNDGKDSGE